MLPPLSCLMRCHHHGAFGGVSHQMQGTSLVCSLAREENRFSIPDQ